LEETSTRAVTTGRKSKGRLVDRPRSRSEWFGRGTALVLGTVWLILVIAPFDYMLVSSLHSQADYFTTNPWIIGNVTFENVPAVLNDGMGVYLRNSFIVTVCGICLTIGLALLFAQYTVKHKARTGSIIFRIIAIGLAVPIQAIVVPLFVVVTRINLYDSIIGLILILSASHLPLSVVIMCTFVRDIPDELVDAMKLDGAGSWTILFRLVGPMSTGAMGLLAIFNGLAMWNNLLIPLLFTQSPENALLPLALFRFQTEDGSNVPAIMMAVLLSALPLIILFLATRKFAMQALGGMATMR
jgi:raffinose/stachyose/melibiose transport system permease protein